MTDELKRSRKATDLITHNVILAMGTAIIPIPMADIIALTTLQVRMLKELCDLYERPYSKHVAQNIITAVAGNSLARMGASLLKTIPGFGTIIGGVSAVILSGASTYAMGRVFVHNLEAGRALEDIDLDEAQELYQTEFETGKELASQLEKETDIPSAAKDLVNMDDANTAIKKLEILALIKEMSLLHADGILTDEEFSAKKQELLEQI